MTASNKIKKALKAAFPKVKFSVTYDKVYTLGYIVRWTDGFENGATTNAVKEITKPWDTEVRHGDIMDDSVYYEGVRFRYEHDYSEEWNQFVIECVLKQFPHCLLNEHDQREPFLSGEGKAWNPPNEVYREWLKNGVTSDISDNLKVFYNQRDYYSANPSEATESMDKKLKSLKTEWIKSEDGGMDIELVQCSEPTLHDAVHEVGTAIKWDVYQAIDIAIALFPESKKEAFKQLAINLEGWEYEYNPETELYASTLNTFGDGEKAGLLLLEDVNCHGLLRAWEQLATQPAQQLPETATNNPEYELWVMSLLSAGRASEIVSQQEWQAINLSETEYKKWVQSHLDKGNYSLIISFEDWLNTVKL